jgi:3-methylcrotonyl-CoA carboxylase alpha subunit
VKVSRFLVTLGTETLPVEVVERGGRYHVRLGEEWLEVDADLPEHGPASLLIGGASYLCDLADDQGEVVVTVGGETHRVRVEEAGRRIGRRARRGGGDVGHRLSAPMPGRVVAVHVKPGDRVEADTPLVTLEAMKMENEFRAAAGGVVVEVAVTAGQTVNAGDLLVVVETSAAPA